MQNPSCPAGYLGSVGYMASVFFPDNQIRLHSPYGWVSRSWTVKPTGSELPDSLVEPHHQTDGEMREGEREGQVQGHTAGSLQLRVESSSRGWVLEII